MKRTITAIASCTLCLMLAAPALAAPSYIFSAGEDALAGFGRATSSDSPVPACPMSQNVRRNKDAAFLPPPYFHGSGHIPTDPSSLHHINLPGGVSGYHGGNGITGGISGTFAPPPAPGFDMPTSIVTADTAPRFYPDGSIGTIHVGRTGRTIRVFHGETEENMRHGAGHFVMTSAWDGNVALCGHNRGTSGFFSFVKDLQTGDRITYTTPYGVRTYEVFWKERINEYDHSVLGWSAENILTLVTCVENSPSERWAAQLREVR
jgi:sortase A